MAIISTLDFDSIVESSPVSPDTQWSSNGVSAVATSAALAHGARGARYASTDTAGRLQYDSGANQTSPYVLSWYMRINTHASQNLYIASVRSLTTGGSTQGDIRINTTHTVTLRNASLVAVATSTETLSADVFYRFEWRIDQGGGTQELRVYEGESTTPHLSITGAWSGTSTRVFSIGPYAAAAGGALDYDTVRVADSWTGPFIPAPSALSTITFDSLSEAQIVDTASLSDAAWDVYTTTTQAEARGAAALHGGIGALIPAATGPVMFNWNEQNTTDATRVMSFYFRLVVDGAAATYLGILRDGTTNVADWRINADRTVTLRNAQVASGGNSAQALATNTWYRVEWKTASSGQELRIYVGEGTTPYITQVGALTTSVHTRMSCGITTSPNGHSLHIDTLRVTDDWAGPYTTAPEEEPEPEPVTNTHFFVNTEGELQPFKVNRGGTLSESVFPFWISHYDTQARQGYAATYDGFEQALIDATEHAGPIGSFIHGYSSNEFPSTFQSSSVASAPTRGIGAMLNVKRPDWSALAAGDYDSTIESFFNSWPVETFGSFTINHEPENDGPTPANATNQSYVDWASVQGPIWCEGIAHTIAVAAPIIRARGLKVKLGGCLMDFSWDVIGGTVRWQFWDWWNYVDPQYLDVVEFQIDAYTKTVAGTPPRHYDLLPRLEACISHAREVGIEHFSLFETANDRRLRNGGDTMVGNDESVAVFWEEYFYQLKARIPETRMVNYFSIPDGPASGQAAIMGRGLEVFGDACLKGRRP